MPKKISKTPTLKDELEEAIKKFSGSFGVNQGVIYIQAGAAESLASSIDEYVTQRLRKERSDISDEINSSGTYDPEY